MTKRLAAKMKNAFLVYPVTKASVESVEKTKRHAARAMRNVVLETFATAFWANAKDVV